MGFPVEYVASYATPGAGSDWRWSRRLRGRLRAALSEADPDVLVFDGTHPYEALIDAMPLAGTRRVWCRRPMWKPGASRGRSRARRSSMRCSSPASSPSPRTAGPTVARRDRAHVVDADRLPRRRRPARRAPTPSASSASSPGQPTCWSSSARAPRCARRPRAASATSRARDGVQVGRARSALAAARRGRPRASSTCARPIRSAATTRPSTARSSAAGYNAYHELIALRRAGAVRADAPADRRPARPRALRRGGRGGAGGGGSGRGGSGGKARASCSTPGAREAMRERLQASCARTMEPARLPWLAELADARSASPIASGSPLAQVHAGAALVRRGRRLHSSRACRWTARPSSSRR